MSSDDFRIRNMRRDEISLAIDWAAEEGWNPGLADESCFASADPKGFFIGEYEGKPAATLSVVNYGEQFAFLGFYIVRPDLRGRGFGLRIWKAGMAHAGSRTVGLDGVTGQQDNYRKSGFIFAYSNIRYGGVPSGLEAPLATVPLSEVPLRCDRKGRRDSISGGPARIPAGLGCSSWTYRPGLIARRAACRLGRHPAVPPWPQDRSLGCG